MRPSSRVPSGADMAGLGLYFAAAVLIPIVIGAWLDGRFHTGPLLVLIGLFVGLVAGGAAIWVKVREFTR